MNAPGKSDRISYLKWINRFIKQKPFKPSHLMVTLEDFIRVPYILSGDVYKYSGENDLQEENVIHIKAAMDWLCNAQDVQDDGGVSACYSFRKGWEASYPETTGYIIPTFFDYYHFAGGKEYEDRALKMADWLVSIQMTDGAFQGGPIDLPARPSVFNTGQIIIGLVRAYIETKNEVYAKAAERAAAWCVEVQDSDGAWRQHIYNNTPHSYYTRVAWSLLKVYKFTGNELYREAAKRNLKWVLSNQYENGWINNNSFEVGLNPFTHTIVYSARGLFESGLILNKEEYIDAAQKIADVLCRKFEMKKVLLGEFDENWSSRVEYCCITGNAQLSILLMKLNGLDRDERYLNTALKINQYLRSTQLLSSRNLGIRGGIKGSDPVWGNYLSYRYPNWAAKFFVDALLLEEKQIELCGEKLDENRLN